MLGKTQLSIKDKELKKRHLIHGLKRNASLYILILPVVIWFFLFSYIPMMGAVMAFQDFSPAGGIFGSDWVGFRHFKSFFTSYYFGRLLKNTLTISVTSLVVSFPLEIILALLINEIRVTAFKKTVQTVTYMPHFISVVVMCGMVKNFVGTEGLINDIAVFFGGDRVNWLSQPNAFVPIYVISGLWQNLGWNSIIFLAALAGVDQELYESAYLDGAGRLRQTISITIPCIMPTIVIMLILSLGGIVNVGYEKIILLYNPGIYSTADVISTFVYRKGLQDMQFSYSTAVGLFNSAITIILVLSVNALSRKLDDNFGIW